MLAAPIELLLDLCLFRQNDVFENILLELLKSRAVHNIADVLLMLHSVGIDVFFDIGVGVFDELQGALLITPFDEILRQAGISLAGTAQQHDAEIVLGAACPGPGGAIDHAYAAADAFGRITRHLAVDQRQGVDGAAAAEIHALQ